MTILPLPEEERGDLDRAQVTLEVEDWGCFELQQFSIPGGDEFSPV